MMLPLSLGIIAAITFIGLKVRQWCIIYLVSTLADSKTMESLNSTVK